MIALSDSSYKSSVDNAIGAHATRVCIVLVAVYSQLDTMPGEEVEDSDPARLTVPLMTHQRRALAWMRWREDQHPTGGILGES